MGLVGDFFPATRYVYPPLLRSLLFLLFDVLVETVVLAISSFSWAMLRAPIDLSSFILLPIGYGDPAFLKVAFFSLTFDSSSYS